MNARYLAWVLMGAALAIVGPACVGAGPNSNDTGKEESSEDVSIGDVAQADTYISCAGLDRVSCMIKCAEAGAPCRAQRIHPYRSEAGVGPLVACKTGTLSQTCTYRYANGDQCTAVLPLGIPFLCNYGGGWIP